MITSQMREAKVLAPNGHCKDGMGHVTTLAGMCCKCHTQVR